MTQALPDMYKTGADIKKRLVRLEQPLAEATPGVEASVSVAMQPDGKLKYSFVLPKGPKGDPGKDGAIGPQGPQGKPGTTSWNDILDKPDFVTKSTADLTYLPIKGKAESAKLADKATSADKATQDASGNVITSTYATKTEVTTGLNSKLGKADKAASATTADSVAWTGVTGRPDPIPKTGDTGTISVMETIATASTVSDTSARSMTLANGGSLTVSDGSGNKAWITVVALQGGATINLGSLWAWSGSAPTLAKGLVTLAWYGSFGVATFTKFGS